MIGDVEEEWTAFKNAVIRSVGCACGMKRLCKRGIRRDSEW